MQAAAGGAKLCPMTIDMHTHFVPEQMAAALRQRTEPMWIETMPEGSERIHLPIDVLDFGDDYSDMAARIAFMDARGVDRIYAVICDHLADLAAKRAQNISMEI